MKKTMQGTVVTLSDKTAKVRVDQLVTHPVYQKRIRRTKQIACHVDGIELTVGDIVTIESCRPVSKTKKFKVASKVADTKEIKAEVSGKAARVGKTTETGKTTKATKSAKTTKTAKTAKSAKTTKAGKAQEAA